jgi:hypothetical protein
LSSANIEPGPWLDPNSLGDFLDRGALSIRGNADKVAVYGDHDRMSRLESSVKCLPEGMSGPARDLVLPFV